MKVLPVVMAGGFGKRLWPISTTERPKQFIYFFDEKYSCFQKTIQRIRTIFVTEEIAICCNHIHIEIIKQQLADINENNYILLVENDAKNTFISTLFCLKFAQRIHADTLFVSPTDSFIKNNESFAKKISNAVMFSFIENKHVLFGIKPTKACDRYGYIKIDNNNKEKINNNCYYKIKSFKEKPNIDIAKKFIESGDYFWNSGHFIFDVNILLEDIKKYQKSAFVNFKKLKLIAQDKNFYITNNYFYNLPTLPIDKAIIEKSHNFVLNKLSLEWHDIGNIETLEILIKAGKISIPKECYLVARRDSNFLKLISNL